MCKDILKSNCSKGRCLVDGKKPNMIIPAAATLPLPLLKSKEIYSDDDDEDNEFTDSEDDDLDSESDSDSKTSLTVIPTEILKSTWETLSPPITEESILGKWYAVIYSTKKTDQLFIGKIMKRFLTDKDGPVDFLEVRCLKPKVGSGTLLDDTPAHLPDISNFRLTDVIYGPLNVVPMKGGKFDVINYENVFNHYKSVKHLNRDSFL